MCWSHWKTQFFFTELQFQWKLDAEEPGELEEFLEVHLEDHEDLFLSNYNYQKWIQDSWKPNALLLQGDSMVTSQMVEKWIPLNIFFNWFLQTPDVQEIIFYTICDVTIESLCNNSVLGFQGSWIHFW